MTDTITYDYIFSVESHKLQLGDVFDKHGDYLGTSIDYSEYPHCDSDGFMYYLSETINDILWIKFNNPDDCNKILTVLNKMTDDEKKTVIEGLLIPPIEKAIAFTKVEGYL